MMVESNDAFNTRCHARDTVGWGTALGFTLTELERQLVDIKCPCATQPWATLRHGAVCSTFRNWQKEILLAMDQVE